MILHYDFIKSAKKYANNNAIVDHTTGQTLTYKKALIASLILKEKLEELGEKNIGVLLPTSAGAALTVLGSWMAGITPVMINYSMGVERNCNYAREKCNFQTIITSKSFLEKIRIKPIGKMVFIEDILASVGKFTKIKTLLKTLKSADSIIKRLPKVTENTNVVILFTSGSEKDPKAVPLTHKNIGSNVVNLVKAFQFTNEDMFFSGLPLFHVFGFNTMFSLPVSQGMTIHTHANPLDYKKIPELIRETKSTVMATTPVFLAGYLRESNPGDFSTIKTLVAGADKLPEWIRNGFLKDHGVTVLEGYGTTETSPVISSNLINANKPGSIGPIVPNLEVKIISEDGEVLKAGEQGKILVKGDSVFNGYLNDEEQTKKVFIDGWYDTGDIGILDEEGFLWHKGRAKRFEKIGGEMVSLVKIESVIESLLPSGSDCCVVGIPDENKGTRLIAATNVKDLNEVQLRKDLLQSLTPLELPKSYIYFPSLPKMGSGKLDFRKIEQMVAERIAKSNDEE